MASSTATTTTTTHPILVALRRVTTPSRAVGHLMIPGTLLMLGFAWIGRGAVGSPVGWGVLIIPAMCWWMVPWALGPAVIACVRAAKGRRADLGNAEAVAQLLTWVALFVWGLAVADGGDLPLDRDSALIGMTTLSKAQVARVWEVASWACVGLPLLQMILAAVLPPLWCEDLVGHDDGVPAPSTAA